MEDPPLVLLERTHSVLTGYSRGTVSRWAAFGAGCCRARRRRDHALLRARALRAQPGSHRSDPFVHYSYPLCACFPTLARVISALSSIIRTLTRIVRTLTRTIPTLSAIRSGPASSVPHCRSRQGQFVCLCRVPLAAYFVRRQTPRDEQEGGGFDDDDDGCVSHRKSVGA